MAITLEQALRCHEVHQDGCCSFTVGPRGGQTLRVKVWRRNGAVKTWKTRSGFRMPVKYGMYGYDYVDQDSPVHLPSQCPALAAQRDANTPWPPRVVMFADMFGGQSAAG